MAKRKLDITLIKWAMEQFSGGLKSAKELSEALCVDDRTIREWFHAYQKLGIEYFLEKTSRSFYTKDLKLNAVKEYLNGGISLREICLKYNISGHHVLRDWIRWYNEGKEFKDYHPKQGLCLMKSRKVLKAEKLEIVEFCIRNLYDYKLAAEKFSVPYTQVYQWVRKHKKDGAEGLEDRRGKRKPAQTLSEIDLLKRELAETKRKLEYAQIENEILKKKKKSNQG